MGLTTIKELWNTDTSVPPPQKKYKPTLAEAGVTALVEKYTLEKRGTW